MQTQQLHNSQKHHDKWFTNLGKPSKISMEITGRYRI
jgi:hypothetical protein